MGGTPPYHPSLATSPSERRHSIMGAFLGKFTDACGITTPTADVVLVGCGVPARGMGW